MSSFWQVWLHRTSHWGLAWATGMCLGLGIATGAWWLAALWAVMAALDLGRTRKRQLALRQLAIQGTPMDTWPEGQPQDREAGRQ